MSPRRREEPQEEPEGRGITIVGVEAHNFHRLEVAEVEHVPGQGLVRVTGKNRQGKTSLLSAIAATLGGAAEVRRAPIRVLETDGSPVDETGDDASGDPDLGTITRLKLSNGFRLTRRYTEANPKGYLTVEGPDGGKHGQGKLDGWLGALAFDPLGFYGLKADRQREVLLSLGTDTELPAKLADVRARAAETYEERTPWIAQQRAAARIQQPAGERPVPVDVTAELARMGELQVAERRRAELLREYERAKEAAARVANEEVDRLARSHAAALQQARVAAADLAGARELVADLERRLAAARDGLALAETRLGEAEVEVELAEQALAAAPDPWAVADAVPAPELPEDPAAAMDEVRARIQAAEARLAELEPWRRWDEAQASLQEATHEVDAYTRTYRALQEEERALVAAAGIPVPGLSFGEGGEPLLNGLPLEVASGAERIRLAVEVAVAAKPDLRVALVDEANDLDLDALAELDTLARSHGFQVWACRLGLEGPGEVVVADGRAYDEGHPALVDAYVEARRAATT